MFIPVPIKAKYFIPGFEVDLYLESQDNLFLVEVVSHILLTLEVLYLAFYCGIGRRISLMIIGGTKQFRLGSILFLKN
jgi:hypothetical protein